MSPLGSLTNTVYGEVGDLSLHFDEDGPYIDFSEYVDEKLDDGSSMPS